MLLTTVNNNAMMITDVDSKTLLYERGDRMENQKINLTEAEWNVMECLWERHPKTGREIVECMNAQMGWSRSTTLTLLRRLEEKEAVGSENAGTMKMFSPMITRESAALQETEDFLQRVYKGSIGMMVSAFTKKQSLTKAEIEELYAILGSLEVKEDD